MRVSLQDPTEHTPNPSRPQTLLSDLYQFQTRRRAARRIREQRHEIIVIKPGQGALATAILLSLRSQLSVATHKPLLLKQLV